VITKAHILEVHKILVENLTPPPKGEGSNYPGNLRQINVDIKNAEHTPPEALHVQEHMEGLINFINQTNSPQHDLLVTALPHHRMQGTVVFLASEASNYVTGETICVDGGWMAK